MTKSKGLGRGLNALFDDEEEDSLSVVLSAGSSSSAEKSRGQGYQRLGVEQLTPGVAQPRMDFDQGPLEELAESIRVHGILQPLLVRPKRDLLTKEIVDPDQYEIIAGERRWRAAQLAQLHDVPVIVRDMDDSQAMQIALIENLQREDLNPVEESLAYQRLMDEHNYTQAKLAEVLGRSRSHIANMVRLLTLPENVLTLVRNGGLTPGHARALITVRDPARFAEKIIAEGMSVRETERYIGAAQGRSMSGNASGSSAKKVVHVPDLDAGYQKDADTLAIEQELSKAFGLNFRIESKDPAKGGYLRLDFKDMGQLNDALSALQRAFVTDGLGGRRLLD
jgi:ParB family chromosome partitioning protein